MRPINTGDPIDLPLGDLLEKLAAMSPEMARSSLAMTEKVVPPRYPGGSGR